MPCCNVIEGYCCFVYLLEYSNMHIIIVIGKQKYESSCEDNWKYPLSPVMIMDIVLMIY